MVRVCVLAAIAILVLVAVAATKWYLDNRLPRGLSLTIDYPRSRDHIPVNGPPIRATGLYGGTPGHVRAVRRDYQGLYYVQNPPADLLQAGQWVASNVVFKKGIEQMHIVQVNEAGRRQFDDMVRRQEWRGFPRLPRNSVVLASIPVVVTRRTRDRGDHLGQPRDP